MRGASSKSQSTSVDILLDDVARLCASEAQSLSILDRAHQIERVLSALGWNVADPTEVTRQGGDCDHAVSLMLSVTGVQSLSVTVCSTMKETNASPEQFTGWAVATDGVSWRIWRGKGDEVSKSILTLSIDAEEELHRYLSKSAHAFGLVDRIDISRQISALVEAEIDRVLANSPNLVDQMVQRLPELVASKARQFGFLRQYTPAGRPPSVRSSPAAPTLAPSPWLSANCPGGDIVWPDGATHMLRRKGCASFIRCTRDRRTVELLPGSVMRSATRASFPLHHRELREDALIRGYIVPESDLLRVVAVLLLDTPSTAATMVSGTVENGWTAWRDRDGKPIPRVVRHGVG